MSQWTTKELQQLYYAAGHLCCAEEYPEDAHAGDSRDLGLDTVEEIFKARCSREQGNQADVLAKAERELAQAREEIAALERPHKCAYSGLTVRSCQKSDICDCFGGSTWQQRAIQAERALGRVSRLATTMANEHGMSWNSISARRINQAIDGEGEA